MAPTVSEPWVLFRSLSRSEKRYLNLALKEKADVQLRTCMTALQAADGNYRSYAEQLAELLPDPKIRSKVRRRLYMAMLDALVAYGENKDPDLRLHRTIQRCRVLLLRGLYSAADKLIRQGIRTAEHYDRKWALAVLAETRSHWEGLHKAGRSKGPQGDALFQEAYLVATDYAELSLLKYQDAVLIKLFNAEGTVGQGKADFFSETLVQASQAQHAQGFFTRYYGLKIQSSVAFLQNDRQAMVRVWRGVEQLFDEFPHMVEGNEASYFKALHFQCLMALSQQDTTEGSRILDKLREARPVQKALVGLWGQMYYSTLAQYGINVGCEDALTRFVAEVPDFLPVYQEQMETVYVLLISTLLGISSFMLEDYTQALYWIKRYLQDGGTLQMRKGIQVLTTIRLCIYIEQEDWDTLEHAWNATPAYLDKHIIFPKFWEICQRLFSGLLAPAAGASPTTLFRGFWEDCEALFGGGEEANLTAYFDFMAWAQSQLEGRSLREVVAYNFANFEG